MSTQLKIAYYLPRFPRLTETFILREMLALMEKGHEVQVFSLFPPKPSPIMHNQVYKIMSFVHYCPFLFSFKLVKAQFYFLLRSPLRYLRALMHAVSLTWMEPLTLMRVIILFPKSVFFAKQVRDMKIDHIHAHFVWVNGIAAQIAADLIDITYSIHAHAWDIFQRKPECVRRQIELANVIVTISDYHRNYLATLCPTYSIEKIHVVHCGLNTKEFTSTHIPVNDNLIRIVSVGSLIEKKGHEYLIHACGHLLRKKYKFHCSIVGSGPLYEQLQACINGLGLHECVTLLGSLKQNEILDLYRQSDISVLACVEAKSGDKDGIPVALMEAMAMQVPVISTPVAGIPELIDSEENGLLVPEHDVTALAIAMERLINDLELRNKLGLKARKTIIARFDIHQTSDLLVGIFQEICQD
ncbi:MAG: glycosyltransferase [Anaerolineaceae bacterium]|nr:glycosyltransferase [Anaerolineaceae bacterium]